jgi:O-antigen/teichoic acid export membrane protein
MAFPAGNALNYQGMLLAVGAMLGPVPVVVFSALRTLARSSTQLTTVIQSAVWPELSRAHGASDHNMARTLHRYSCQASLWISIGAAIPLALLGSRILALWTHGRIAMDTPAYLCLLVVAIINSFWTSSMVALLATNEHGRVAIIYLIANSISIPVACVLMLFLKLSGAAVAMLATEFICCWFVVRHSLAMLGDSFVPFSASMTVIPPVLRERLFLRTKKGLA